MSWGDQARMLFQNVWSHHQSEMMRIERARQAKAAELDPDHYALPFPSQQKVMIQQSSSGLLKGALIAAACLGTGGVGTVAALHGLGLLEGAARILAPTAPQIPPAATPAPPANPTRYKVTFRTVDGREIPVGERDSSRGEK